MPTKKAKAPATHFVVERYNWRWYEGGLVRIPGSTRLKSFEAFDDAERFCREQELVVRKRTNPFLPKHTVADLTTMPEPVYCDWLRDHSIEPPEKKGNGDWAKWWTKAAKKWSAPQLQAAWEPLTKSRYFRVVEKPKREVGYALVQIEWMYNDEWYYPSAEGGNLMTVYRSREKAMAECEKQNTEVRESMEGGFGGDMENRLLTGQDPFLPHKPAETDLGEDDFDDEDEDGFEGTLTANQVPFYEVIEVELEGV